MKSERVGLWLSLLANLGVLIGLFVLVVELRHNTFATQALLHQENVSFGRDNPELLIGDENKELAEIVFRGESDPESLSPIEFEKFFLFTSWRMAMWETQFLNFDTGLIGERIWLSTDGWFSALLERGPGYRRWWEAARRGYDPEFQDHVDDLFKNQPCGMVAAATKPNCRTRQQRKTLAACMRTLRFPAQGVGSCRTETSIVLRTHCMRIGACSEKLGLGWPTSNEAAARTAHGRPSS